MKRRILEDPFKDIEVPEWIDQEKWAEFKGNFSLIWSVFKETGQLQKNTEGPGCPDEVTILLYVRGFYNNDKERYMKILDHLTECPHCLVESMERHKEEKSDFPIYVKYLSEKLELSLSEVRQIIRKLSERNNSYPETMAGELTFACGLNLLSREEMLHFI